jgi:hypothetical protein
MEPLTTAGGNETRMTEHKRSVFDWLTILAAWAGVGLGGWTAYVQYQHDQRAPEVTYGQYGANFTTESEPRNQAHWRMVVSNQGDAPAENVRVKVWDVPKDAKVWTSIGSAIEERTDDTLRLNFPVIPAKMNVFIAIKPFVLEGKKLMPYSDGVYSAAGSAKEEQWLRDFAKDEVFQVIGRIIPDLVGGFHGWHRSYDTPINKAEVVEWAEHSYSVEDRYP